ncbi:uncharacterized protein BYT42DRAFT_374304 [Radiomyces spectabilis]|uniref:uncharacterized protein n=1 Tax=Radiomyces spectabilis TaxID=64574 RepID=UPI00222098EA|nr:uncharacterized protein BYT42DRAFT_374304 [Radiomyces spectabilis]KAI8376094.1 hypothetical protein BYT42DRAFT_374304 [Radiomyces spectabilis]
MNNHGFRLSTNFRFYLQEHGWFCVFRKQIMRMSTIVRFILLDTREQQQSDEERIQGSMGDIDFRWILRQHELRRPRYIRGCRRKKYLTVTAKRILNDDCKCRCLLHRIHRVGSLPCHSILGTWLWRERRPSNDSVGCSGQLLPRRQHIKRASREKWLSLLNQKGKGEMKRKDQATDVRLNFIWMNYIVGVNGRMGLILFYFGRFNTLTHYH